MCKNRTQVGGAGIAEIMTRDLITINKDDSVHESLELMAENHLSALPVVNRHGHCIGILSQSDLAEVFLKMDATMESLADNPGPGSDAVESSCRLRVAGVMSTDVQTITEQCTIAEAATLMSHNHIHHLPVVDANAVLVGFVSSLDIVKFLGTLAMAKCCTSINQIA